jgi:fatty-acid desaturase
MWQQDISAIISCVHASQLYYARVARYNERSSINTLLIIPALSKFQAGICKLPIEDKSNLVISIFIVITSVGVSVIFVRLASKTFVTHDIGLEDYIIVLALVSTQDGLSMFWLTGAATCNPHYSFHDLKYGFLDSLIFIANFFSGT